MDQHDSRAVTTAGRDGTVRIWDVDRRQTVTILAGQASANFIVTNPIYEAAARALTEIERVRNARRFVSGLDGKLP